MEPEPTVATRPLGGGSQGARRPFLKLARASYFVACNTLLLCLVLEIGWRAIRGPAWTRSGPAPVSRESVPYALHPYFQNLPAPDSHSQPGPFLAGWVVDPHDAALARGRFRILFLGGSTTANGYPPLVRSAIEAEVGPATAYVLAMPAHCSLHSLYKLWTYGDDIAPDLVIVLENINDFYRGFTSPETSLPVYRPDYSHESGGLMSFWRPGRSRFDGRDVFYAPFTGVHEIHLARDDSLAGLPRTALRESALARSLVGKSARPARAASESVDMPDELVLRSLPDFERNMRNIASTCRAKGFPVLFLTMPFTLDIGQRFLRPGGYFTNDGVRYLSPKGFERGMERFNAAVRSLEDEPTAYVIDLAEKMGDPSLFLDEVHLLPNGVEAEARLVADFILERRILVEPRNR